MLRGARGSARRHPRGAAGAGVPRLSGRALPHGARVPPPRRHRAAPAQRAAAAAAGAAARDPHARDGGRGQPDHAAGCPCCAGVLRAQGPQRQLLRARAPLPAARRTPSGERWTLILL